MSTYTHQPDHAMGEVRTNTEEDEYIALKEELKHLLAFSGKTLIEREINEEEFLKKQTLARNLEQKLIGDNSDSD